MNFLRSLPLMLVFAFEVHGAVPSFTDFNNTQFDTTGNKVTIKNGATVTNLSGAGGISTNFIAGDGLATNSSGTIIYATNIASAQLQGGAPAPRTASYITIGTDGTLTSERVLTSGNGVAQVDGGAGSTLTVYTTNIASILTYSATPAIDFSGDPLKKITLTGDAAFTTANLASGKTVNLRITGDTVARNVSFPAGLTNFMGGVPTSIAANAIADVSFISYGTTDQDVVAAYGVNGSQSVLLDPGANGVLVRTSSQNTVVRTNTSGTGMAILFPDGVSGNPTYYPTNIAFTQITNTGGLSKFISATATLDFASLVSLGCEDLTITVTGAAVGDTVALGVPNASIVANGNFTAWVSSANTVSVRFCTVVSGDPPSGTFRATVVQF